MDRDYPRADGAGPRRGGSPWPARIVFLAIIVLFPAQLAVKMALGEPYPALFQPSFAGTPLVNGQLHRTTPRVTIVFRSGEEVAVSQDDVLPRTRLHVPTVFREAFWEQARANDPRLQTWLAEEMATRYDEPVAKLMVTWIDQSVDPWRQTVLTEKVIKTVEVEM